MRGNGAVAEGGAVERLDGVEPHGVQREADEHRCRENTVVLGRILWLLAESLVHPNASDTAYAEMVGRFWNS